MNNLQRVDEVLAVIDQPEVGATIAYRTALRRIVKSGDQCVVLSQLCYWYGRGQNGRRRLQARRDDKYWLAKCYRDIGEECGLDERQARAAVDALVKLRFVERRRYKFAGKTVSHLRLNGSALQQALNDALEQTS